MNNTHNTNNSPDTIVPIVDRRTGIEPVELVALIRRFETHLDEHRSDETRYIERQLKQDLAHEEAMRAINDLTVATKGLVDSWHAISSVQRFFKWLSGFAFLGIIIAWGTGNNPFK